MLWVPCEEPFNGAHVTVTGRRIFENYGLQSLSYASLAHRHDALLLSDL